MMADVASPPPPAAPSADRAHPTYKEMIMQALTELRDPGGSSRGAIAGYIDDHFSGLHLRHDSLLTVHLRKLESHGQLRLVSGNYIVSTASSAPGQKRGRGRPRKNASASVLVFQGPKRGRGRPRKNNLRPVAASARSPLQGASAPPPPSGVKRGRGRPRKNSLVPPLSSSSPRLGATYAPPPSSSSPRLGATDPPPPPSGVKRSRGRPRKNPLVPMRSSFSQLLGSIAPPPLSGVKRGRGRPRKNASPALAPLVGVEQGPAGGEPQPQRNTTPPSLPPAAMPHSGKSKPFRLSRVAVDVSALRGSSTTISSCNNTLVGEERGLGHPPKVVAAGEQKMQPESVQSVDASLTKRGRGRPRKEKALESGHLKAAQMTEGQHEALAAQAADQAVAVQNEAEARDLQSLGTWTEKNMTEGQQEALTAQAADQAGAVQNEVEARDLQSLGSSLTEKRGRGRPRKRPLETGTAEAGASAVKRGRGRPRKEKTLETGDLKIAQMTEGGHEARTAQASDQAGVVQNQVEASDLQSLSLTEKMTEGQQEALTAEAADQAGALQKEVEARDLLSLGTSLTEKRGRGRPRKRPLETGTAEAGVAASAVKGQQEALTAEVADQAGAVLKEVEARDLLSLGTSLTEKRGRGRPRKRPLETGTAEAGVAASAVKRGRGRPRKEKTLETGDLKVAHMTEVGHEAVTAQAADQAGVVQSEVEASDLQSLGSSLTEKTTEGQQEALTAEAAHQAGAVQKEVEARDLLSLGTSLTEKGGRGRPRKRPVETKTAEAGVASTVKRGRGRPRKEKTLEIGDLKVAQMTEGGHEALPAQAVDQTGPMQNEAEARILQSLGTPLMEKRGRGRPRKKSPSAGMPAGTMDTASMGNKRGRGRPRKDRPFENGSVETAVEVSRDLSEDGPEKDGDLVSGKKAETHGVPSVKG